MITFFFVSPSGFGVSTIGHRWKKYLEMVPSVGTNFNKKYCTARYRDLPRSRVPPPGEHCPAPVQKQWFFDFLWYSILSQPQVWLKNWDSSPSFDHVHHAKFVFCMHLAQGQTQLQRRRGPWLWRHPRDVTSETFHDSSKHFVWTIWSSAV